MGIVPRHRQTATSPLDAPASAAKVSTSGHNPIMSVMAFIFDIVRDAPAAVNKGISLLRLTADCGYAIVPPEAARRVRQIHQIQEEAIM